MAPEQVHKEAHEHVIQQATAPRPQAVKCSELKSTACPVRMRLSRATQLQAMDPEFCRPFIPVRIIDAAAVFRALPV